MSKLADLMAHRFGILGVAPTRLAWARHLGNLDKATLSRILNGSMPLSPERASKWGGYLFPGDATGGAAFAQRLLEVAQASGEPPNVSDFFDNIVRKGGAVPAESIADLFTAVVSPSVRNAALLIEYRDIPRAGPQAKYQSLASDLAAAVVAGLAVGMFMPFKLALNSSNETRSKAEKMMEEVRDECRVAYRKFVREVERLSPDRNPARIGDHLALYEPAEDYPDALGTGFQAKTFYLQYDSVDGERTIRHHRIFQWVATPTRDLLVYRGELMISPAALRDSFFPVPHLFEIEIAALTDEAQRPKLPRFPLDRTASEGLSTTWNGFGLPLGKRLWKSVDV